MSCSALAAVLFAGRAIVGPSLSDRVIGIDGVIVSGMSIVIVNAMDTGRGAFLPTAVVLALVSFVEHVGGRPVHRRARRVIGSVVTLVGAVLVLLGAIGVVRFPDALARMHALTKASTVGVGLVAIGSAFVLPTANDITSAIGAAAAAVPDAADQRVTARQGHLPRSRHPQPGRRRRRAGRPLPAGSLIRRARRRSAPARAPPRRGRRSRSAV